jgi:hypothetical protein
MNFLEFTTTNLRSVHIYEDGIEIYVRRGNGFSHNAQFELATLSADEMGKGALTRFLDRHEPLFTFYVENVLDDRLINFFKNRGYRLIGEGFNPADACMITPECWHIRDRNYGQKKEGDITPPSFKP